jgi:hypothetical protein
LLLLALFLALFAIIPPARAMPEYATRVGEPCATCHVSPAGGGLRNLRGQAWVASDKPSTVPSTAEALTILGLSLPADMSIYTAAPATVPTPMPLRVQPEKLSPLLERLLEYDGD